MSLIISYINKFGIIIASDSNLTDDNGNTGFGQKVFPIPHLNAGLAHSGCYRINGQRIDDWMNEFINGSAFVTNTLQEFTHQLCETLNKVMRDDEISVISIIHICGYPTTDYQSDLEHWHISNCTLDPKNGNYLGPNPEFHFECDFNSRDNKDHRNDLINLDNDSLGNIYYINGFPPGRISANFLRMEVEKALAAIWRQPDWGFRKPQNLFETSQVLELNFHIISELFKMSSYKALYIGGKTQTHLIPVPQNINKNNWG